MVEILQKLLVPQVTSARLEQNGQPNSHVWQVPREQQLEVPQPLVVLLRRLPCPLVNLSTGQLVQSSDQLINSTRF